MDDGDAGISSLQEESSSSGIPSDSAGIVILSLPDDDDDDDDGSYYSSGDSPGEGFSERDKQKYLSETNDLKRSTKGVSPTASGSKFPELKNELQGNVSAVEPDGGDEEQSPNLAAERGGEQLGLSSGQTKNICVSKRNIMMVTKEILGHESDRSFAFLDSQAKKPRSMEKEKVIAIENHENREKFAALPTLPSNCRKEPPASENQKLSKASQSSPANVSAGIQSRIPAIHEISGHRLSIPNSDLKRSKQIASTLQNVEPDADSELAENPGSTRSGNSFNIPPLKLCKTLEVQEREPRPTQTTVDFDDAPQLTFLEAVKILSRGPERKTRDESIMDVAIKAGYTFHFPLSPRPPKR